MNAVTPDFPSLDAAAASDAAVALGAADVTAMRWKALNEAGRLVAILAGEAEIPPPSAERIGELLAAARPWQRDLAATSISDLAAMMEPGIATLLDVHAAGSDPHVAANALWREFKATREAVLNLLEQTT